MKLIADAALGAIARANPAGQAAEARHLVPPNTIALPWFKCDAEYMLSEIGLRECSLAARGLYFDLLCLMHKGQPYGHLARSGKPLTMVQVAKGIGCHTRDVTKLIPQLCDSGVLQQLESGLLWSPYLVAKAVQREEARANGRRGGNPRLKVGHEVGVKGLD